MQADFSSPEKREYWKNLVLNGSAVQAGPRWALSGVSSETKEMDVHLEQFGSQVEAVSEGNQLHQRGGSEDGAPGKIEKKSMSKLPPLNLEQLKSMSRKQPEKELPRSSKSSLTQGELALLSQIEAEMDEKLGNQGSDRDPSQESTVDAEENEYDADTFEDEDQMDDAPDDKKEKLTRQSSFTPILL